MKKLENIDFLIFDLGNVIIDIDYAFTINTLKNLLSDDKHILTNSFFPAKFHKDFEKGLISAEEFRNAVRNHFQEDWSDALIDELWNSLLKHIPMERIELIKELGKDFGLAVLSNTNSIHVDKLDQILLEDTGEASLNVLFDRVFFSHEMGLSKPDEEIYKSVIQELGVQPERTLFFDDLLENLNGAKKVGLQTFHINHDKALIRFFQDV
ncbi:HAD family phosphatase [Rhodonellum sp.]|uniref:HAD family hydrolase n=1 Tax=Rhodonellum sp. TaxID=2231180 RepID=UPI0027281926|nr:HAD family phosphatase [Rhodonellum sp.]MDO9553244.1 HAD family phosphatase [Rhodonellum sp.]